MVRKLTNEPNYQKTKSEKIDTFNSLVIASMESIGKYKNALENASNDILLGLKLYKFLNNLWVLKYIKMN